MSAAGEECSFGMATDNSIGCPVAAANSVSKDINEDDVSIIVIILVSNLKPYFVDRAIWKQVTLILSCFYLV
jgi:hypothetical protein